MSELNTLLVDDVLSALGEQLNRAGERIELVVIGGSGLLALGLIDRSTRDVDIVALRRGAELVDPRPLPDSVIEARDRVAADFALPEDWLNAAPASAGFRHELLGALAYLGVESADLGA